MAKRSKRKSTADSAISPIAMKKVDPLLPLHAWYQRDWVWGSILIFAVILAYGPVWHAGFIWDDDYHLTTNPCIIGPLGLKEIWTTSAARIGPLTFTTFWVEDALWGLHPLPYHLVNVLLHGASAILLWRVLLGLRVPGAWLGAALWALHPVEVESVAWITEMKNTQSCLFYLLTVLFFVKALKARDSNNRGTWGWNDALTLLCAALAMTSKSSTVILPIVLCLCAWWMEGRWNWRNLVRVGPIILMSVAASALSIWTQKLEGGMGSSLARSWPERLATAGDAVWFYLGKLLWPHPLIMVYPRWQIDVSQPLSYLPLLAVIIVLFIFWLKRESWSRPWFFAFTYFLAALLPVLGLVEHSFLRYSFVGDHFQYLASMGPLALAGAGLTRLADFMVKEKSQLQASFCAGLLLVLGMLSWQRARAYASQETLWVDTVAKNPNCWVGYYNLGVVLIQKGQVDAAMARFQQALEINPNDAPSHNNLGNTLAQTGHTDEAMVQFLKALDINPNYAEAHENLGNAFAQMGHTDEAIIHYQRALDINPNFAEAHYDLGNLLVQKGRLDEAIGEYRKALEANAANASIHTNLGIALVQNGQVNEAIAQFQQAVRLNPQDSDAQANLAKAQAILKR